MLKVDLHTHSVASPDGGITAKQYERALHSRTLDYIAITDHNRIDFALELQKTLGERIIVGEEIMSAAGEIIGLFLKKPIDPDLTPLETMQQIKAQGGIVYIPHPFETVRKGLSEGMMNELAAHVDCVEIGNGRALLQNRSQQASRWIQINGKVGGAGSDAHGSGGLGKTYTLIRKPPARGTLVQQLQQSAISSNRPGIRALLYPKYHRIRKGLRGRE